MLQPTNREKEGKLFVGRGNYIKQISDSVQKHKVTVLLAPSGFGRTALLKKYAADSKSLYIDLRKLSLSPESFAVDFIGNLSFLMLSGKPAEYSLFQDIEGIKQRKLGRKCAEIINTVGNELQKIKPDHKLLLASAIRFAEELAAESKKRISIVLNNSDELLKLNNYSQVKDIFTLFYNEIAANTSSSFILSSSAHQATKSALKSHQQQFIDLSPFTLEETGELFEKIAGKSDERLVREVHALSAGIPVIVNNIASRFRKEKTDDVNANIMLVKTILLSDLATRSSNSYFYCSKLFSDSLNRARGDSLPKIILKAVSQSTPMRLTEISRRIYRSAPVTKSLLERLIEVDLLVKSGNTFDFANPVLKVWCRLMFANIEFAEVPDDATLREFGAYR
jgi:hypothetical protein